MSQYAQGVLCAIISAAIYGAGPTCALYVYADGASEASYLFWRYVFSALALLPLFFRQPAAMRRLQRGDIGRLLLLALFMAAAGLLLTSSYTLIGTGIATTLHFSYPVFTLLGCALFYHDRIQRRMVVCVALTLAGVALCYAPGGAHSLLGVFIAFISGAAYAMYLIYLGKSGLSDVPPVTLSIYLSLAIAALFVPYMLATDSFVWRLSAGSWLVLAVIAAACSAAMVLLQLGVKYIGPQSASVLSTFEPLTAVVIGLFFLNEPFSWRMLAGVLLVLASVLLLTLSGPQPAAGKRLPHPHRHLHLRRHGVR